MPTRRPGRPAARTATDGVIADCETLLAAAEKLIRAKSPNVSLQAIAAHAGVTKPSLYRDVGDRDALVNALAERLAVRGAAAGVSTVWSYGVLGALHFVTLWWLRDQASRIRRVIDRVTDLLWSGLSLEERA